MQGDIEGGLDDLHFHTYLPPGGQVVHVHHQLQVIVHQLSLLIAVVVICTMHYAELNSELAFVKHIMTIAMVRIFCLINWNLFVLHF